MFVQVIQGKAKDGEALQRQLDRWLENLRSGASGYLGTTAGVTDDGEVFMAARFESEEAARANSDRPEQGEWWQETSQYFEGEPTFSDYKNVELMMGGGSDDAGFVQVMQGKTEDLERVREMDKQFEGQMADLRPDLIGGINCWTDDGAYTSINYFTSEAEARANEAKEMPEEMKLAMKEWETVAPVSKWIDLKDPWLHSGQ